MKYEYETTKFYNALRKYGYKNFTFEVIEECSNDPAILDERERYWIEFYDSYKNGYNSTLGGRDQSWIYNPDTIRKMWDDGFSTGEIKKILGCGSTLIYNRLQGYKDFNTFTSHQRSCGATAEWRKDFKLSENQLQYFNYPIEVHQYDLDGNYITSYPSYSAAARAVNCKDPQNIARCCTRTNQKTSYGYQWSQQKVEKLPITSHGTGKLVRCINTGEIFHSIADAARWAGIKSKSTISHCCMGVNHYKSAGKHPVTGEKLKWEYVENMS